MLKKLKALLCILAVAAVFYVIVLFALPFYRYYAFESDARDILRFEMRGEEQMTEKLMEKAEDLGINLTESDVAIYQNDEGRYNARITWSDTVNLLHLYSRRFDFTVDVGSEEMKKRGR